MSLGEDIEVAGDFTGEVASRFGVLPNFFRSARAAPGLIEDLWGVAKSAYLDSPLPSLFKERLFVHLSRYCEVRYCVVRHVGFLMGEGRPAGDAAALPHTLEQILKLLRRAAPDAAALDQALLRLEAPLETAEPPLPETQEEADLFDALTVIFLAPQRSARARNAVRTSMGERLFEISTAFLAFVRTAHYWTETHPELAYEPDMLACMEQHPELAALLLDTSEAAGASASAQLREALWELDRTQGALKQSEAQQTFLLRLADALRPLSDPVAIQETACRVLGEHLRLDWVHYSTLDLERRLIINARDYYRGSLPSHVGRYPMDAFPAHVEAWLAGRTMAVDNVERCAALGEGERLAMLAVSVRAALTSSLVKDDAPVVVLSALSSTPREWRTAEIKLLEETADRTWAAVERAHAETALRQSEELRRIALEGGRMGAWRWDLDSRLIWADASFLALWGLPASNDPRPLQDFTDRMSPEGAAEMEMIVTRAIATGEEFDGQLEIVAGPTAGRWVRWRGVAELDKSSILHGVSFDVTDHKLAERRLRESEGRFRAFVTATADVVYRMSPDWSHMRQLDGGGFLSDTDEPSEEWMDRYILPEDQPDVRAAIDLAIQRKSDFELEHRVRQADGAIGWTSSRAVPILNEAGEITEWLGAARDATAVKAAHIALRESEARLTAAFESVPVGVAVIDMDGEAAIANAEYRRFLPGSVIPSRDSAGAGRWRAWDTEERLIEPQDYPAARAMRGERVVPGQEMLYTDDKGRDVDFR